VPELQYDVYLPHLGSHPDAVWGQTLFEVKPEARADRFHGSLMLSAQALATESQRRAVFILDEPAFSIEWLTEEWKILEAVFRPEIFARLAIVVRREGVPDRVFGSLLAGEREQLDAVVQHVRGMMATARRRRRPTEAFFDILRVLLVHWCRRSGPLTSKQLGEETGFTYPTIAAALERLEPWLRRHSDRRVELHSFPRDAWFQLVAQAERERGSEGYVVRGGRARSVDALLVRLQDLQREDIAVSGVAGARHHHPGLDLVGTPRLDLILHSARPETPSERAEHGPAPAFLRRLDPALQRAARGESPHVVLHRLYRPQSFFAKEESASSVREVSPAQAFGSPGQSFAGPFPLVWADPIECLLDLHEARLEPQAQEFLEHLQRHAKNPSIP
jgi:hypothetical protein